MNNDLAAIFGGAAFDPNSVEPAKDFDVLPPGKYSVLIESAEVKQTKAGTGHYLGLVLLVVDGPCKNRKLFDNINLQNPNVQCEEIGRRTYAALCLAVGLSATDATQLVNKVVIAHVKVKNDQNNVRTYSVVETQAPTLSNSGPMSQFSHHSTPIPPAPAPTHPAEMPPIMGPIETYAAPQTPAPAPVQSPPQAPVSPPGQQAPPAQGSRPWDRQ